jgi:hypothetical protein
MNMNDLMSKVKKLKQKQRTWYLVCEPAPTWIGEDDEDLIRPFMTLVADIDNDLIRLVDISEEVPDEATLLESALKAMLKPGFGTGGKYRPTTIQTSDTAVLATLQPLVAAGIQCQQVVRPALVTNMLHALEEHLTGQPHRPGLLAIPKMTEPLLRELYTAAAEYVEQAPWDEISDSEPIAIRFPPEAPPKYGVVMGYGGEEYGLAIYNSPEELLLVYSGVLPQDMEDEAIFWLAALFDWPHYLPFDDLDAIAAHEWPVAAEDAHPLFTRLRPAAGTFEPPTEAEIRLLAAALRTVPQFVANYLDEDGYQMEDLEDVVYELSPMYGHQAIALNWADIDVPGQMPDAEVVEAARTYIAEFIEGWDFDDDTREEALELGAFLLAFIQLVRVQESEMDQEQLEFLEDVCWQLGAMLLDYAERPIDLAIFNGPPLFVEEFKNEMAEDEEEVEGYRMLWTQLGEFASLMGSFPFEQDDL